MFTRLREFARSYFGRQSTAITESASNVTAQAQTSEVQLAVNTSQKMVTTRARDHELGETTSRVEDKVDGLSNGKKRKSGDNERSIEREATSGAKRRRLSQDREMETGIEEPPPLQAPDDVRGSQSSEALLQFSEQPILTPQPISNDTAAPPGVHGSKAQPPSLLPGGDSKLSGSLHEDSLDNTRAATLTENGNSKTTIGSNMGKKRKKGNDVAHTLSSGHAVTPTSVMQVDIHGMDRKPEMKKATHKRFGSEEAQGLPSITAIPDQNMKSNGANKVQVDSEDESEDDSPEVVTASAGLTQARSTATEAARAAETQSHAQKEKRRARDAHLKEQAATSKKERQSHGKHPSEHDDATSVSQDSTKAKPDLSTAGSSKSFSRKDPLPDLLPIDVLAAEPVAHLPTPPRIVATVNPRKRRFLDADPKPPKDLKRGSVTIRILEDDNSILPPRSSKVSEGLKESWLAGQRGRNDVASRRLKMGGGFVRK